MTTRQQEAVGKLVALAAVTGMRTLLGPALLAASRRSPGREAMALAALGEMAIDKMPLVPSRSHLGLLIPRVLAGYWVGNQVMEDEGMDNYWMGPLGAAVAAGVAITAPKIRRFLNHKLNLPDPVLGLAEDALAVGIGSRAVGLTGDQLQHLGESALSELRHGRIRPAIEQVKDRLMPSLGGV